MVFPVMHLFTLLFIGMLLISTAVELWLLQRQMRSVANHRGQVPEAFAEQISLAAHQKAADYTLSKARLHRLALLFDAGVLLLLTLGGGLQLLDSLTHDLPWSPIIEGTAFILGFLLLSYLLESPFVIYRTFRIEQRFDFNHTTPRLFVLDMLKQFLLMVMLVTPLTALVLWLMESTGRWWWFDVWLVWSGFSLLMMWAYPAVIAPLFNKFTPLDDESLRQRINNLLQRCGFTSNGIFVMDGSRRSSHGNAYFSGLGSNKRIVFFDTLLQGLNADEIEAVLAHELGHFSNKHIRSRLILSMALSLAGLALLGWLIEQPWFFTSLGITTPSDHTALVLFMLVLPVFTFFIKPLSSYAMRKQEFEADDFAAMHTNAQTIIEALVKLYEENASTLTPDLLYSSFHDSHPPAPVRIARLSAKLHTS
jgi:STE24 endopeptidase